MILLPGAEDKQIWSYFASVAFPREHLVRSVIEHLDTEKATSTPALEPLVELNRTRLEMVLKVLDVDGAVKRVKGGWISTGEPGCTTPSATADSTTPARPSRPQWSSTRASRRVE